MSCTTKVKAVINSLTSTEEKIGQYILAHPKKVIHQSASELAKDINTSPAALIRFSKKVGYSGFTAFKMDLALDQVDQQETFDTLIEKKDSIEVMVKKAQASNLKTITETYQLINLEVLNRAIDGLIQARRIYLVGVGGNSLICQDLMHKLSRIDCDVLYYDDFHIALSRLSHITNQDILIAISYSGKTREVVDACQYAKKQGAKIISISKFDDTTPLAKVADFNLHVPILEQEMRLGAIASRSANLVYTDLLYYGLAKAEMTKTKEKLIRSREIIKKLP